MQIEQTQHENTFQIYNFICCAVQLSFFTNTVVIRVGLITKREFSCMYL
jgi:hypothetical protein